MIHAKNILLHTLTFKNLSMLKKLFVNVVKLFHLESIIKCLGKVITFYEKMWARTFVGRKASRIFRSFIIYFYFPVSQRYFSCENLAGRDITIHITPWEVVYFLGICSYSNINTCLIAVDDETFLYNHFSQSSTQNFLLNIFNQ